MNFQPVVDVINEAGTALQFIGIALIVVMVIVVGIKVAAASAAGQQGGGGGGGLRSALGSLAGLVLAGILIGGALFIAPILTGLMA